MLKFGLTDAISRRGSASRQSQESCSPQFHQHGVVFHTVDMLEAIYLVNVLAIHVHSIEFPFTSGSQDNLVELVKYDLYGNLFYP